ncbi:hypothetical protein [Pseudomonas vranovensis]|uniref:Integrase n=1 Tax=Pseudomonas vranovensis TaxID=321661 RepID=A0A423DGL2_9PSED|nr:hypothetical protein [Pseudomonas vranovensis]ROL70727.1 hypothetical protein BHU25_16850 [Pseudomonas vranovensis]
MNDFYLRFIESGKSLAELRGLLWHLPFDNAGKVPKAARWDLAALCGLVTPPHFWHSSLGYDSSALEALNALREKQNLSDLDFHPLPECWRDFYQATLLNELLVKRNKPGHALLNVGRPLRIIATCAGSEAPWDLTPATIQRAYNVALTIGNSGKIAANISMVVRTLIDGLHIADRSPLSKHCFAYPDLSSSEDKVAQLKRGNNTYRQTNKLRNELSDRKGAAKLPSDKAFWELVRIVFTEQPNTFVDAIRFNQIKVAIACGFRVGENSLLPLDWARWHEYVAIDGSPAGAKGGISRSLSIRNFAEKQHDDLGKEGIVLVENTQHVPAIFEDLILEALGEVEILTKPLRERLRLQVATGRLLAELAPDSLVPAWDIYTRVTGSLLFISQPLPEILVKRYRESYDSAYLDEIRQWQIERLSAHGLSSSCVKYFNKWSIAPRRSDGSPFLGTVDWKLAYFRVNEVEILIRETMATKLPDTKPFNLRNSGHLYPTELMFLMPIRALIELRNGGLLDINRYFAVGRASSEDLQVHLGGGANNIFSRYGQTEEDRALRLNTHSLRHLQNAELFRLGVADTIITKRFNRHSVAQSYVYDHRSLAEDLAHIDLPPGAEDMAPRAQETLRMITANKIRGPIVDEFLQIQKDLGDDQAFSYLSAEADGLHATPFGFCVNSFTVDPCPKHLECYDCRHLTRSPIAEENQNLQRLKQRLIDVVTVIESIPPQTRNIGWQNQLKHAQSRLESLEKILVTAPGERPFPDGKDLYNSVESTQGTTILDGPKFWSPS